MYILLFIVKNPARLLFGNVQSICIVISCKFLRNASMQQGWLRKRAKRFIEIPKVFTRHKEAYGMTRAHSDFLNPIAGTYFMQDKTLSSVSLYVLPTNRIQQYLTICSPYNFSQGDTSISPNFPSSRDCRENRLRFLSNGSIRILRLSVP